MKLESKYFDRIRVKPDEDRLLRDKHVACDWPGCDRPGEHKAPRGRDNEGEYYKFCTDHVRQYNKSYNYFTGMKDDEVAAFQKDARNGHRPTWKMGENAAATSKVKRGKSGSKAGYKPGVGKSDPFGLFGEAGAEERGADEVGPAGGDQGARQGEGAQEPCLGAKFQGSY